MYNESGSSPTLTDCTFAGNWAGIEYLQRGNGGGMYNWSSSPTLSDCTFTGNLALEDGHGGGMFNGKNSSPTLTGCVFEDNYATGAGGGMHNTWSSSPTMTNCTLAGNVVSQGNGGGMFISDSSSPTLTNCTVWGNEADGGAGIYIDRSMPTLTNCIVWANWPDQISSEWSTVVVNSSDVHGGYPGENNIASDPLLVDPGNGDFHLGTGSPCIDAGSNAAPNLPDLDFEGDDRILDGDGNLTAVVDMGVDEVAIAWPYHRQYLPLVLSNY